MLVDDGGRLLICDFGCSRILEHSESTTIFTGGAARYTAPELFGPEDADADSVDSFVRVTTKESDVYSFAMVGVEVRSICSDWFTQIGTYVFIQILTGRVPFFHIKLDAAAVPFIRKGLPKYCEYPPEQAGTWKVIESCSAIKPEARLVMVDVVRDLSPSGGT